MRFYKISEEQYNKDSDNRLDCPYCELKLPKRATKYSAGYDIYATRSFTLQPGRSIKLPTGIKVELDNDKFLLIVPRSGLGFKYRCQLDNTCGVIDSDYINSDNEGHIWVKLTNDSKDGKFIRVESGEAICQGIIMEYCTTDDDMADGVRNGGFGSTDESLQLKLPI